MNMYEDMFRYDITDESKFLKKWSDSFLQHLNDKTDHGCWTILTKAAENGWLTVIKLLIENGIDINQVDSFGDTALAEAIYIGYPDIVEYLLRNGADIKVNNNRAIRKVLRRTNEELFSEIIPTAKYLINNNIATDLIMEIVICSRDLYYNQVREFLHTERLINTTMIFSTLPQYIILWITDWLEGSDCLLEYRKIRTIEAVKQSVEKIMTKKCEK